MKQAFTKAFNELQRMGVPVFVRPDHEAKGNFGISAEEPQSDRWVSYHSAPQHWDFGVHPKLDYTLNKHGLFAEWETPGSLNVYES